MRMFSITKATFGKIKAAKFDAIIHASFAKG